MKRVAGLPLRTLVYKRTHRGDPDAAGCFGCNGCMGRVRGFKFDAVVGVGGVGSQAKRAGISRKVNWIGLEPQIDPQTGRSPLIRFGHFVLFDDKGPEFSQEAPTLAKHIYDGNVRILMNFSPKEQGEVDRLLNLAKSAPASEKMKIRGIR